MELLAIEPIALLLASAIAAYTDYKTGLIPDWITIPLIILGLGLRVWAQDWLGLGIGVVIFAFLYTLYYTGKLGGGDVKLFTGMALVLPRVNGQILLLSIVFLAALTAMTFYSVYYIVRLFMRHKTIRFDATQRVPALLLTVFAIVFVTFLILQNTVSLYVGIALAGAFVLAGIFVGIEKTVKEEFFLTRVKLDELEEDEIIADEFLDEKIRTAAGLQFKKIVGTQQIEHLRAAGVTLVPVYRNAPRFGPFIFLGTITALVAPDFFTLLFLAI